MRHRRHGCQLLVDLVHVPANQTRDQLPQGWVDFSDRKPYLCASEAAEGRNPTLNLQKVVGVMWVVRKGDQEVRRVMIWEGVFEDLDEIHGLNVMLSRPHGDAKVAYLVQTREEHLRKALPDLNPVGTGVHGLQTAPMLHGAVTACAIRVAVPELKTRDGRHDGRR